MASDPRKLKPSELCRLLNSTPIGEVLSDRQLHRHRMRAENRIGDGKHVDLLRYIAWLVQEKHAPRKEIDGDPYERMKENARARNAAMALAGRDIGELPAIVDLDRKARAKTDFRFFCEAYFPQTFHLPWSPDHLKVTPLTTDEIVGCRDRDDRKEEKRHPASCAKVAVRGRPFADRAVELSTIDQRVAGAPSEDEHFSNSSQKDPTQTVQNKDGDWKLMPIALQGIRHANVTRPKAGGYISP